MNRFNSDIQYGDFGSEVRHLQDFLESKGYGTFMKLPIRFFGDTTLARVKKFQQDNGITPVTGYFGPLSRNSANRMLSTTNREILLNTAISCLGTDASPNDLAPDELGCAETVNDIHEKAFGFPIGGGLSTAMLYQALLTSPYFSAQEAYLPGDVIISPTGYGTGGLSNGHVGIVGEKDSVMSNSSATGLFTKNYTIQSWKDRYQKIGGFPVRFFRRL